MELNDIALKYSTDKASNLHNYTDKYERYFAEKRNKPLKLLEIGIQNGYSLKTWKEYFPNAKIFGIDIVDCSRMDEERIKTLLGSQTDLAFLKSIDEKHGPFDIIIDDGSHYSADMTTSLNALFPLLQEGGLYIVEDLHSIYWPQFSDGGRSFRKRLAELMDCVNGHGKWGLAERKNEEKDGVYQENKFGEASWWDRNVEYIHLYRSIVFIKKYENGGGEIPKIRKQFYGYVWAWRFLEKAWRKLTAK